MPRVIIVDDEPLARQGLRHLLTLHKEFTLVGEAGSAGEAVRLVEEARPDAVFLDIEMADGNGFDVLRRLEPPPAIIFVTAHAKHAVEAFSVQAVDYLLKPVRPERLAAALARLSQQSNDKPSANASAGVLRIRIRSRDKSLRHSSLIALKAEGDYTRILLAEAAPLLVGTALGKLEQALPNPPFLRLSRSLIINQGRLSEVSYVNRDKTYLRFDGYADEISVGRNAALVLKTHLTD